jgi:hypothetical protein
MLINFDIGIDIVSVVDIDSYVCGGIHIYRGINTDMYSSIDTETNVDVDIYMKLHMIFGSLSGCKISCDHVSIVEAPLYEGAAPCGRNLSHMERFLHAWRWAGRHRGVSCPGYRARNILPRAGLMTCALNSGSRAHSTLVNSAL